MAGFIWGGRSTPEYAAAKPKVTRSRRGFISGLYLLHPKHQLFMHVMSISILGHVKFVEKNHLHASSGREITFSCDNFGNIDGAKWHAPQRDLVTCDAPWSTPEHQLNLALELYSESDIKVPILLFSIFRAREPWPCRLLPLSTRQCYWLQYDQKAQRWQK